ncbi:MAG: M14 family zinc carboxypeptidase [Lysobacterales bacterium]
MSPSERHNAAGVFAVLALSTSLLWSSAGAQILTEWTQEPGPLGLGFPVPTPVDTSLPFAGFRTYSGLRTRHQQLVDDFVDISGTIVGQTENARNIWTYQLGDANTLTSTGLPEAAILTQGGIHAREWQSPEVLTGIMERFADQRGDNFLYRYLLDNLNMVLTPVLNVDGFLQTQRFPTQVQLSGGSPRDGRMRRKNMRGVDEDLLSTADFLLGIDLNRNNPPFWATSNSSSSNPSSLLYHGTSPQSESETRAMVAASELGPTDRLRMYTDVHSFSQVHFSVLTNNVRRNAIQGALLSDFSNFHVRLSGDKLYVDAPSGPTVGIGSTDEYFGETFQIPSWTLEIEPSGNLQPDAHPNLPGCSADYGGFASNCNDGFILPDSEIQRVRENLSQTFPIAYYHQAGPPSVSAVRWIDPVSGAVVMDAEWDVISADERRLHVSQLRPLMLDTEYQLWIAFDKPMRWRDDAGLVTALPGQSVGNLGLTTRVSIDAASASPNVGSTTWQRLPGAGAGGYYRYRDDAATVSFTLSTADIGSVVNGDTTAVLNIETRDMVGLRTDANPATPVDWGQGSWQGYESSDGNSGDAGGIDNQITLTVTDQTVAAPFVIEPGISAAWFDPQRNGEGFLIEVLAQDRAVVYWFTYDDVGRQRWFIGTGEVRGNELYFPDLLVARGGVFGDNFDPDQVVLSSAGSASFLWSDCELGAMRHNIDIRNRRQSLSRLTNLAGLPCNAPAKGTPASAISGSWFDPARSGEGFVVEALSDARALVYWFTYDAEGNQIWIFSDGILSGNTLTVDNALISSGGLFGEDFDPDQVNFETWGTLTMEFDCGAASVTYTSALNGFGSGTRNVERLTELAGLDDCDGG